jgi:hypothetical protein
MYPLRVRTLPRGQVLAIAIAGGIIGVAVANLLFGTTFHLDVPIVPGWVNPKDPSLENSGGSYRVPGYIDYPLFSGKNAYFLIAYSRNTPAIAERFRIGEYSSRGK